MKRPYSRYQFEVWNKLNKQIAELGSLANQRHIVMSRNEAETITFQLNLDDYEAYCRRNGGLHPRLTLEPYQNEIRVRRGANYLCGGEIVALNTTVNATTQTVSVIVSGYLSMFSKRHTGEAADGTVIKENYTQALGTWLAHKDLAWSLINQSQSLTYGNFGVTQGTLGGSTTLYEKTFNRNILSDILQNMTKLTTDPIDFWFTADKTFNTADHMGSDRPDIVFEYPNNIIELQLPEDATSLINESLGTGVGGNDGTQIVGFGSDGVSQSNYLLRQEVYNSTGTNRTTTGITTEAYQHMIDFINPRRIPSIIIDGNRTPFVGDYGVGDRITVRFGQYKMLDIISGTYRIERITLDIDDADNEKVKLDISAW